jgi:hypothetical protein
MYGIRAGLISRHFEACDTMHQHAANRDGAGSLSGMIIKCLPSQCEEAGVYSRGFLHKSAR